MSNILSPQGFEPHDPLADDNVIEVYQPTSGGIRRNKQAPLSALKLFIQKLTSFTANNIMESDGTGNPRTTTIATADVSSTITRSQTNENTINDRTNQGVKTTDSPTFADANIGGHAIDAELDSLNSDVSTLNGRVNQGVKDTDSPAFEDVTLTGMTGTVEGRIETNTADISALQTKTPQSYKTTDDVTFNNIASSKGLLANKTAATNSGTEATLFSFLSSFIPSNGDKVSVSGGIVRVPSPASFFSYDGGWIERVNSTTINFHGLETIYSANAGVGGGFIVLSKGSGTYTINSGDSSAMYYSLSVL